MDNSKPNRTKPYKCNELFDEIIKRIELPGYIDYALSSDYEANPEIRNYSFDLYTITKYGGSEGVYTDVYIKGYIVDNETINNINIGTIKTLDEGPEAIKEMYSLAADIYLTGTDFINKNLDDFTWIGYKVTITPGDNFSYEYGSEESMIRGLERLKSRGIDLSNVQITSLATRKSVDPEKYLPKDEDIDI